MRGGVNAIHRSGSGSRSRTTSRIAVTSAGIDVDPDDRGVDEDARRACAEIGARCDGDPLQLAPSLADRADVVVVLGDIDVSEHVAPDVDTQLWEIRDPAADGVRGVERYRLLRDDLRERILGVLEDLGEAPSAM